MRGSFLPNVFDNTQAQAPATWDSVAAGLEFEIHNLTDASWTLVDPDSLVDEIAYDVATQVNTLTWNPIAVGSGSYVVGQGGGAAVRWPRWYKPLLIGETPVTTDDVIIFLSHLRLNPSITDFNPSFCCSLAEDPTDTAVTGFLHVGGYAARTTNPLHGVVTNDAQSNTGAGVNNQKGVAAVVGGGRHIGSGAFTAYDGTDMRVANGSRNGAAGWATGVPLYLVCGFGTQSSITTVTAGQRSSCLFGSRALTLALP